MKRILGAFLLLAVAFTACNKVNQRGGIIFDRLNGTDSSFLQKATLINLAEIASAKLADSMAVRAEVKAFAKAVIANRVQEQKSIDSIAQKWNITLPVIPEAQQLAAIAVLRQVGPGLFDVAWMAAQEAEQKASQLLLQNEINAGNSAQVLAFAKRILPLVQQELAMIAALIPH